MTCACVILSVIETVTFYGILRIAWYDLPRGLSRDTTMHELSIAAYLLETVTERAQQAGARQVLAINLVIGERAGIVEDSLRFSFDLLASGTLAEGARINARRTPLRFHCAGCDSDYTPRAETFRCPDCGVAGQIVDDASALLIENIEIET